MGTCKAVIRIQISVDYNLAKVGFCTEADVHNKVLKVGHMPALVWPMLVPEDLKCLDIWRDGREGKLSAYVRAVNHVLHALCKNSFSRLA